MKEVIKKEFQLGNVKVELSKAELESMLKEINKEGFNYPICCKHKDGDLVVLFDGLCSGKILRTSSERNWENVGEYVEAWICHTNTHAWEEIPYDRERGLYHGQWVWCWDDDGTHQMEIRQYDVINKCSFFSNGEEDGFHFDNFSATCPKYMKEAFQDLINNEKALGDIGIKF